MSKKKHHPAYQHPMGTIMQPIISSGTGEYQPTIIIKNGVLDECHATTIAVYHQYFGIPTMIIHTEQCGANKNKLRKILG